MRNNKKIWAWAFYDWANSAFATTVLAGFFPIFFKQYWSEGVDPSSSTFQLGVANSVASLVVAIMAPLLGAIADQGGGRRRFLFTFAAIGIMGSGSLFWVSLGQWQIAALLFVFASIGFAGGNIFYDSLMVDVAPKGQSDRVSALGYGMGYLGGGVLFAVQVYMVENPAVFGLADATQAVKVSFLMVAVWWLLFTIPLFLWVKESAPPTKLMPAMRAGVKQLKETFTAIRQLKMIGLFLGAYWLYIDGVDTIIRMAVDYGLALGFDSSSLIKALLITQFVGFPAAVAYGYLGQKIGTKNGIYLALLVYTGLTFFATQISTEFHFYVMAVVIGLVQGGIQALSRSFYSRIIPADKAAQFFGFYNMLGKFAAVIGPIMVGWIGMLSGDPRVGLTSVIILFVLGGLLLTRVNEAEAQAAAESYR